MGWGAFINRRSSAFFLTVLFFSLLMLSTTAFAAIESCSTLVSSSGLGASVDFNRQLIRFRVYSQAATRIDLELFAAPKGVSKLTRQLKKDSTSDIWETVVSFSDLTRAGWNMADAEKPGFLFPYYSYRAWGPNWPQGTLVGRDFDAAGNRFNPNKSALDPYALEVSHDTRTTPSDTEAPYLTGTHRRRSSFAVAPKGVIVADPKLPTEPLPTRAFKDEVIYELHVRGISMSAPGVVSTERGTFSGLKQLIPYFKHLGVTAVELMPIFEFQDDANQESTTEGNNYWGYDPISFFAPNRRFVSQKNSKVPGGAIAEFVEMVDAFHAAGLKIYLDVVFNHTAEGGNNHDPKKAKLLSWRALDNATYYQVGDDGGGFQDNTGCGANFNAANPVAAQAILDSLKYWRKLGVDGFRWDLAPITANKKSSGYDFHFDKMDPANVPNRAIAEVPARPASGGEGVDLIAESWGVGMGTYQLGNFPFHPSLDAGFAEWNGKFRDTLRRAENKWGIESPTPAEMAARLAGSDDIFAAGLKGPMYSVNFVTSHDGFTMKDLVSYNHKVNDQPYPYGPTDGGEEQNISWDHAEPGDTLAERESRQRQGARNFMAMTLLAYGGVPMLAAGDEVLRSQNGNNNAYRIDSVGNYFPWPKKATTLTEAINLVDKNPFFTTVKNLIAFRKAHDSFRPLRYATGKDADGNGLRDLSWYQANGRSAEDRDLPDNEKGYMADAWMGFLGMRIDAEEHGEKDIRSIYVAYNWSHRSIRMKLPPAAAGKKWYWQGDTDARFEKTGNFLAPGHETTIESHVPEYESLYPMKGRSVAIFVEK
jgi:isoamylase